MKKTKVGPTVATADLHFAAAAHDEYKFDFIEQTLPNLVAEHSVRRILVLGDVCEVTDAHRAPLVNRIVDAFAHLATHAPVFVLRGNHDYAREDVPFFRFLEHINGVRWINEPSAFRFVNLGRCLFLPYTRNVEAWQDAHDFYAYDWIFCHQPFGGAAIGGRDLEGAAPPFPAGARVVAGDIHSPQRVGPVTYVGAPYPVHFGDTYTPRVLLLDGNNMTSLDIEGGRQKRVVDAVVARDGTFEAVGTAHAGDVVKVRVSIAGDVTPSDARRLAREYATSANLDVASIQVIAPERTVTRAMIVPHQDTDVDRIAAYAKKMRKGRATINAAHKIMGDT